jgi:predicted transcriptional regulator YdeE
MITALILIAVIMLILVVLYIVLIGNIKKAAPEIVKIARPIQFIGLSVRTSDKSIYQDVGKVTAEFNRITKEHPIENRKKPWAFVAVSKNYDKQKSTFDYIVGEVVTEVKNMPPGLDAYEIPALTYAVFSIKPKSRLAWGITMGRMKRYIYTEWLPNSGYEPSDLVGDFEFHDDRSLGKRPEIQLFVAVEE